ncbi:hypothetical protein D3C87_76810 [compost metagenome]
MDCYNGIEDIKRAPLTVFFNEGRRFGWIFSVTQPIIVTKLMFFNDDEEEVQKRNVTLYKVKVGRHEYEQIYQCDVTAGPASWGFEDVPDDGIELQPGGYLITMKIPHYASTYYVPFEDVEFGAKGIKFATGLFENINDIGWLETTNCYMVSFEYLLSNN